MPFSPPKTSPESLRSTLRYVPLVPGMSAP